MPHAIDVQRATIPSTSCPALCRASTSSLENVSEQDVDGRDKPGHDEDEASESNIAAQYAATAPGIAPENHDSKSCHPENTPLTDTSPPKQAA